MLTAREKNQKLIELQLSELSDRNIEILFTHMNSLLYGQKKKAEVEEKLQQETFIHKSIVGEDARIEIIKTELPKPPKKKRPRIVKQSSVEVSISTFTASQDQWFQEHTEGLRKMFQEE